MMEGHTPLLYKASEIEMKHNFGAIEIKRDKSDKSIEIIMSARTINDVELFSKRFSIGKKNSTSTQSLDFDRTKTRYSKMCR
jgi:hypothetical protein